MDKKIIILICMLFCHIVDDYYLQGRLASLKQKSFWTINAPDKMYKYDYIMALLMHSISWSFMVMFPILIFFKFAPSYEYGILFVLNAIIHMVVDDLKANKRKINLIQDQCIHFLQLIVTLNLLI